MTFATWLYARQHAADAYTLGTDFPQIAGIKKVTKQEIVGAADQAKLSLLLQNVAEWPELPNSNDPSEAKRTAKALELNGLLSDTDHREIARTFLFDLAESPFADYWTTI